MTDAWSDRASDALRDEWRALRDDARYYDCAAACVRFAYRAGLLNVQQEELWLRRLTTCPGHDDEGGRVWCAYCGNLPKEAGDTAKIVSFSCQGSKAGAAIPLCEYCRHKATSHAVDDEERRECMEFSCACEQFAVAWDGKCGICREPLDLNTGHVCSPKEKP